MLRNHIAKASYKQPSESTYRYQSLIFQDAGYGRQIRILDGVLQDTFASPYTSTPFNNNAGQGGYTKINRATEGHYISTYYGASTLANYPFRYGTFSYAGGFSAGSLFSSNSGRSRKLFWSPDGQCIVSYGDIFSTVSKFNNSTGVPTLLSGTQPAYAYAGFTSNSNTVALSINATTKNLLVYPFSFASGLGTQYTNPTPLFTIAGPPLWLSDNSFVIIGNRAYSWSSGFTGTTFDSSSFSFIPFELISDTLLLGLNSSTYEIMILSFDKTKGFSTPVTLSGSGDTIQQTARTPIYDPVYKRIYYTVYDTGTVATTAYYCPISAGVFGSPVTLGTKTGPWLISDVFTHKLLG